ncbi:Uncharacterized protein dnm_024170 [Desulfonema magnum]|uniref:Uncharacterized protein n=1 Tax=Desulfonema magnum TaxID=45655 RepID=A0A975BJC0_9BACT|nr:Uncharacterized protein dnm_024170 [Desulfonema magnum]
MTVWAATDYKLKTKQGFRSFRDIGSLNFIISYTTTKRKNRWT